MSSNKTYIITKSGGEHGMGHLVRMGHLAKELRKNGERVTALDNLRLGNLEGKNLIVDVPITDNEFLDDRRAFFDNIIVIVGTGWSITPETRKLANLIVYQGVGHPSKEVLQSPGGAVLYGLEWLILGKDYETRMNMERKDFVLYYCGGGIPQDYADAVDVEMRNLGLEVLWANGYASLYKFQSTCALQVSTFGMATYEALTLRTPVVSFSRSEDHANTERGLAGWLDALGIYENLNPTNIAIYAAIAKDEWPHNYEYPEELDGKGARRLADYIMSEL